MENKREHSKPEMNSGERLVDTAGYISRERRIKALIRAGKRLEELRLNGAFDYLPGEEIPNDIQWPKQRSMAYDLADASMDLKELKNRIEIKSNMIKKQQTMKDTTLLDKIPQEPSPKE